MYGDRARGARVNTPRVARGSGRALLILTPLLVGFDAFRAPMSSVDEGNELIARGKVKEALSRYEQAAKEQPDLAGVHYNRGVALEKLGKLEEARQALVKGTQSGDRSLKSKSFFNLGNVLFQLERYEEASAAYQNALRLEPRHAGAKWNLELALRKLEQQQKEREKKEQEKKQDPQKQDPQKQDPQKQDPQKQDPQKQDPQKQDPQKQDPQKQDPQKQDPQKQDPQKQDPQKQDPQKQDPRQPTPEQPESQELQRLLDALDRSDQGLQRQRARMLQGRRRPPEKNW